MPAFHSPKPGFFWVPPCLLEGDALSAVSKWVLSPNGKELEWMMDMSTADRTLVLAIRWLKAKNQELKWNVYSFVIELAVLGMYKDSRHCHDFTSNTLRALARLRVCLVKGLRHPYTGKVIMKPGYASAKQLRCLEAAEKELWALPSPHSVIEEWDPLA